MGYDPRYAQPQRRSRTRLAGIIILGVSVVAIGMVILIGVDVVGAVFTEFDPLAAELPAKPAAVYSAAKSAISNSFALASTMIIIAAIIALCLSIFGLGQGGSEF